MSQQIERLPDGHLATNEPPGALAALIAKFERGLVKKTERAGGAPAPPNTWRRAAIRPAVPNKRFFVENSYDGYDRYHHQSTRTL